MKRVLWVFAVCGSLVLLLLGLAGCLDWVSRLMVKIHLERNQEFTPYRVGVLGDSQKGLANLRNIARAVRNEKVSVLLHTGDLVSNNDDGHYRLAWQYLQMAGCDMPIVAPGNHDLKGGSDRFVAWFEELEQSFTERGVAFVILNNAFGNPLPNSKHVEDMIAAAGPHQAVVVAMHQPPFDVQGNAKPEYADFLAWLEKSKVDYLVCGHVHGYLKKKVGDTTVIINGVGGDSDKWQFDQKVYATILEIDGSKITDRSIVLDPVHEIWENVEHLAIGHIAEAYRRRPIPCWGGTLLLAGGVAWAFRRICAMREPFKPSPG